MLGLEITDLQDAIDLCMEAEAAACKLQFCFGQSQVFQSLRIIKIWQIVKGFLLGIRQYG
jgi:hypothetical protein